MGILIAMPNWMAPSEQWSHRMIEALEPDVVMIAAPPPCEPNWRGKIPSLCLTDGPASLWRRGLRKTGLNISSRPGVNKKEILRRAIEDSRVDTVLVQYLNFALDYQEVWDHCKKPLFIHGHGYDITPGERLFTRPDRPRFGPEYWQAAAKLSQHATFIVGSEYARQMLICGGISERSLVVKNLGVPVPDQPRVYEDRRIGLAFLYLGRLTDCKGPDAVIRAFELACNKGLDARLIMAGDGDMWACCHLIHHWSKWRDRIHMLGAVTWEKARELMTQADIFVAHSCIGPITRTQETFGVAFVEAMAMGLPVLTCRAGALPEIITHEIDGLLLEPGDIEGQANRMLELAAQPELRQKLGQAARRTVLNRFTQSHERNRLRTILGLTV